MLNPRELREKQENVIIGQYGILSVNTAGREIQETEDEIRTCFQRDVDRIIHSKSFRRLKHKTQVFLSPEGDHYRTRLTHTLEVTRIARTIARSLQLNEDLTEAAALGHDLGHTPFGHAGERALNEIYSEGFKHYEQSLRVVDILEREGRGLNLCYETRMGILDHTHGKPEDTLEATAVRYADHIAYVNHDLDDAIRAGIVSLEDVPKSVREMCGDRNSRRINAIVSDLISNSQDGWIKMSPDMQKTFHEFHQFMFSEVYTNPKAKSEESKVKGILECIYSHYMDHPEELPAEYLNVAENEGIERAVCDYVSGMTDSYAMEKFGEFFIPSAWTVK